VSTGAGIDPTLIEASNCALLGRRPFRGSPTDVLGASRSALGERQVDEFQVAHDVTKEGQKRSLAGTAYAKGMFDDALSLFTEVLDDNPLDYQSWCLQGHVYFLRMELESALFSYRRAARVALTPHLESIELPSQYADRLAQQLGQGLRDRLAELLELGEADAAALLALGLVGDGVESQRWGATSLVGVARTLGDMGDAPGAFTAADGAYELDPSRVDTAYELAIRADVAGEVDVAERAMVDALRLDPVLVSRLLTNETRIGYPSAAVDVVLREALSVRRQMRDIRDEALILAGSAPPTRQPDADGEAESDLLSVMWRNQLAADELNSALESVADATVSQAMTQEAAIARSVAAERSSARLRLFSAIDIDPWMVWLAVLAGLALVGWAMSAGSSAVAVAGVVLAILGTLAMARPRTGGVPRHASASATATADWQSADRLRETARAVLSNPLAAGALVAAGYQDYALVLEDAPRERAFEVARYVQELLGGDFARARRIVAGAPVVVLSAAHKTQLEQARRRLEGYGARAQVCRWADLREEQRWH
jgi:tetratricopeptide (TPR) repeat protein/ribosomal protein L7/L12